MCDQERCPSIPAWILSPVLGQWKRTDMNWDLWIKGGVVWPSWARRICPEEGIWWRGNHRESKSKYKSLSFLKCPGPCSHRDTLHLSWGLTFPQLSYPSLLSCTRSQRSWGTLGACQEPLIPSFILINLWSTSPLFTPQRREVWEPTVTIPNTYSNSDNMSQSNAVQASASIHLFL